MEMKLKMDIGNQCIEELTSSHYVSTSSLCIECLANIKDFFSKDNEPVQWEGGESLQCLHLMQFSEQSKFP